MNSCKSFKLNTFDDNSLSLIRLSHLPIFLLLHIFHYCSLLWLYRNLLFLSLFLNFLFSTLSLSLCIHICIYISIYIYLSACLPLLNTSLSLFRQHYQYLSPFSHLRCETLGWFNHSIESDRMREPGFDLLSDAANDPKRN